MKNYCSRPREDVAEPVTRVKHMGGEVSGDKGERLIPRVGEEEEADWEGSLRADSSGGREAGHRLSNPG